MTYEVILRCDVAYCVEADDAATAESDAYNQIREEYEELDFDVHDSTCINPYGGGGGYIRDPMDYYPGID